MSVDAMDITLFRVCVCAAVAINIIIIASRTHVG